MHMEYHSNSVDFGPAQDKNALRGPNQDIRDNIATQLVNKYVEEIEMLISEDKLNICIHPSLSGSQVCQEQRRSTP